ncbi:MAG: methyltransferase domain-containing protein [Candidatus Omnitrophica bacterium]|jgi:ubiquinone/menaquinone biosynthesis C-methylase UbiE|nr:methyltransferase domain-containing protein [Candidatus Omnitrophota bacterium]
MQINFNNFFIGNPHKDGRYYLYDWEHLKEKYVSIVNKEMIVVEIGCTYPQKTYDLARHCKMLLGIEIDKSRLVKPEKNIKIINADWQNLGSVLKENSVDIVVSSHVLEHVPDDLKVLNETYKVLRKGGVLLLITPSRTRLTRSIAKLVFMESKFIYPEHLREYSYEELLKLVSRSAFSEYRINKTVLGLHSGKFMCYLKKSPAILDRFTNFFEAILIK